MTEENNNTAQDAGQTETPAQTPATPSSEGAQVFGAEYVQQLRQEAAQYRVARNEEREKVEALQTQLTTMNEQFQAQFQEQLQAVQQRLEQAEQQAQQAELARLRLEAASQAGLAPELAARLQGATAEELQADAQRLAELIPAQTTQRQARTGGGAEMLQGKSRSEQLYTRARRGNEANALDPEFHRRQGGGIVGKDI